MLIFVSTATEANESARPHIVILIAEGEYQTDQSLTAFANKHLTDFRTTMVRPDPGDKNQLVGIESVKSADVLVVSVRRRTLPNDQLQVIRDYIASGKPVIGIRTASHAFCLRNQDPPPGRVAWPQWDQVVFGGNYTNHHGNQLTTTIQLPANSAASAVLLHGIDATKTHSSSGSLYQVSPLAEGTDVYLTGRVDGHPPQPLAWSYVRADGGKSFYTSLGHVDDFRGDVLPKLLVNAIEWAIAD
ncbi:MAG: hypothetical protein HKN47_08670 [Pirellulaceae bacterium]|nr:hypothetical protein [Pirellulaceae bacterium]